MARLRKQQFANMNEVNQAMAPLLTRLNDKLFQKLPSSRASTFAEIDAPARLPLPLQRYEMVHFKTVDCQGASTITSRSSATAIACSTRWLASCLRRASRRRAGIDASGSERGQECPQ
jgi:hypothetical protein